MNDLGLPLREGDTGPAIRDLHRRLAAAGFSPGTDSDRFDLDTVNAVRAFQASRRIVEDGSVGRHTWNALIEADNRLGDRMLYLRSPMTRGDDVTDLQQRLGSLGFDAGYVDGIFGPDTEHAVRSFQANQGVTPDGVVGPDTIAALARLAGKRSGDKTIAEVKEAEMLRHNVAGVGDRRIVLGETGGLPTLVDALARRLRLDGAEILTLHHPDLSKHARTANDWAGTVYMGLALADDEYSIAYFQTEGFVSAGGQGLARHASRRVAEVLQTDHPPVGMRLPILRETRMPAIWCRVGHPTNVVEKGPSLAAALHSALLTWCSEPLDPTD
ncbi:MAG: peptidoglycan-binding domain-containing protein [Acidimicrobiales bacterium]